MLFAMMETALWTSLIAVGYCYLGYPALVWACARLFGRVRIPATADPSKLPCVTLLIVAHNEERCIGQRIRNALEIDYPHDRLEIVVASDGSSDRTVEFAAQFAEFGVRLLHCAQRRGKAATLNAAVPETVGEIVVFSDANTFFEPAALGNLVRWFGDSKVGAVCGKLVLTDARFGCNVDSLYWKYETFLKICESRLGALLGANGAIYALRRSIFAPIPVDTIIDDFTVPLMARLRTGQDIVYDSESVAWEECPPTIGDEFRRRSRIGAGGYQAITRLWRLLLPQHGWIAFTFFSHKVLRWMCPFFLVAAIAANALCLGTIRTNAILGAQIAFYAVAAMGPAFKGKCLWARLARVPTMFTLMNVALLHGLLRWLAGPQTGVWQRTARPHISQEVSQHEHEDRWVAAR